jgi:dTMP kinase
MAILVIEGLDGSGKSTQVELLKNYISNRGKKFEYLHFPRTDSAVYGDLVSRFLRGELGDINQVNPYLIALLYAGDRFDAKPLIDNWLEQNVTIILDRYVYSNVAYQCAKVKLPSEVELLKKWILDTEFGYFKLPKPDLNIFLDVPFEFTKRKLSGQRDGSNRSYLDGKRDIHEEDLEFQNRVRNIYLSLENECFVKVDCCQDANTMLPADKIFNKIVELITDY